MRERKRAAKLNCKSRTARPHAKSVSLHAGQLVVQCGGRLVGHLSSILLAWLRAAIQLQSDDSLARFSTFGSMRVCMCARAPFSCCC